MVDLVIFATLAIFVVYKLRKILGDEYEVEHTGKSNIKDISGNATNAEAPRSQQNVIKNLVSGMKKEKPEDLTEETKKVILEKQPKLNNEEVAIMLEIYKNVPGFSIDGFLNGSINVFEKSMEAYSNNKTDELSPFVSDKIAENFKKAINSNIEKDIFEKVIIAKIESNDIVYCEKTSENIYVSIKFKTQQISYTENVKTGELLSGSKSLRQNTTEVWTYTRSNNSQTLDWVVCDIKIDTKVNN